MGSIKARWNSIGKFIGSHTAYVAPASIICGILLAPLLEPLRPLVPTMFAIMTFQGALGIRFSDVKAVARHPIYGIAVLLLVLVVMPIIAFFLAHLVFPDNRDVIIGATIEFSEPIAVMCFIWIGMLGGNIVLALTVILLSSVVTPFTMPLTLSLLLGETVAMDSVGIMLDMLYMVAVPAVIGLIVNDRSHGWGKRVLAPVLNTPSRLIFVFVLVTNATAMVHYLNHLDWATLGIAVFILGLCVLGFVLGFVMAALMKAPTADRVAMGYTSGMRNISVGAVIAASYFSGTVVFTVIIAIMFQQILAATYKQVLLKMGVYVAEEP